MLDIITSDALSPLVHGFFGRRGGASSGIFHGLNCGRGSSDLAEVVTINRTRVARAMGVAAGALQTVHQVHSATVTTLHGPMEERMEADALVTNVPGLALGILTADCLPVLFADREAGVIGAAHAGWRGAKSGVLQATLHAMAALGAEPSRTVAVIGPAIGPAAYEVGPEFMQAFVDEDADTTRFFHAGSGDRMQFDLPGYALARLTVAGVNQAAWTGHCTVSDPARFFSYRRSQHRGEADYGRMIAAIRL